MKKILSVLSLFLFPAVGLGACGDFYDTPLTTLQGDKFNLCEHKDKPIIFVNTASKCGFTSQFEDLERLYSDNKDKLLIVGFPSNDFNQELDTDQQVKAFCELTYGIDMPMSITTSVKGNQAHPFFKAIKKETGFVPSWNFNKVLIDRDGNLAATWGSTTNPMSAKIVSAVKEVLNLSK